MAPAIRAVSSDSVSSQSANQPIRRFDHSKEEMKNASDSSNGRKGQEEGDDVDVLHDVIWRFLRGFSAGACLHTGYTLTTSLLRSSLKVSLAKSMRNLGSTQCLRTAAFLGLFPAIYKLSLKLLRETRGKQDGLSYGIAGALAGVSAVCLDRSNRQTATFFAMSRAIGSAVAVMVSRGELPLIPYSEVVTFALGCSVILYSACMRPDYLSLGYYRSILKWTNDYNEVNAKIVFRNPLPEYISCQDAGVHLDPSCIRHNLMDIKRSLPAFIKIHLPIHALPVIFYKWKLLKKNPVQVLRSFIKNMAASTGFLVTMVAVGKSLLCLLRYIHHGPPPIPVYIPMLSAFIASGLGLLCERESRRKELTLFVIFQVLGIAYSAHKKSSLPISRLNIPLGFTTAFSLSMMTVMYAFEKQPSSLNSVINAVLRFFVGKRDVETS